MVQPNTQKHTYSKSLDFWEVTYWWVYVIVLWFIKKEKFKNPYMHGWPFV